jgi:hypothetical protein
VLPIKKKKKQVLIEGFEENKALQEADYMAESESEVGEADVKIEVHVCNFFIIDISCISLCLRRKHAVRIQIEHFLPESPSGRKSAVRIRIARFLSNSFQAEKALFK